MDVEVGEEYTRPGSRPISLYSKLKEVGWLEICLHTIVLRIQIWKNLIRAKTNCHFSMTNSSRASLAFAFYAYTSPFQFAPADKPSTTTITLLQIANDAQVNCHSYVPKRKRDDSLFCEVPKKRRSAVHMDHDWEMIDV